jgi:hypothetical protein
MAIKKDTGAGRPPPDLEPSARPLLDRRELSARRADEGRAASAEADPFRDAGSVGAGDPVVRCAPPLCLARRRCTGAAVPAVPE